MNLLAPYLLYLKLAAAVALLAFVGLEWMHHNSREQQQGAAACIQGTTITKGEAQTDVAKIEADHAAMLARVSDAYVAKLAAADADRAGMADRLRRADALRSGGLPALAGPAGEVCRPQVDAAVRRIEAAHAESFAACLANQDEVAALRTAWADLAARGQKKGAAR